MLFAVAASDDVAIGFVELGAIVLILAIVGPVLTRFSDHFPLPAMLTRH